MNTVKDNESSRISKIFEHLAQEGFRPERVDDTSVKLKFQGSTVFVDIEDKDQTFYSIICAYIWEIESDQELINAYKAASKTAMALKVAKAFVTRDEKNVWLVMEQFFPQVEQFLPTLVRGLEIVANGRRSFCDDMRKLMATDEPILAAPSAPSHLLN